MLKYSIRILTIFISVLFINMAYADVVAADAEITAAVQSKITNEAALSGTDITVSTANGVVSLSGSVESNAQASTAIELAQSTAGVTDVNITTLAVKGVSDQPLADTLITAKIKGMFIQQKLFGDVDISAMAINVETNNGVVTLSGKADNQTQVDNAITIAKSVTGVKSVKSTVQIVIPVPANVAPVH